MYIYSQILRYFILFLAFPIVGFSFLYEMYSLNQSGPLPRAALCIQMKTAGPWPSPKNNVLISGCRCQATGVLKLHLTRACQALQAVVFRASSLSWGLPDCPLEAFSIDSRFLTVMFFLGDRGTWTYCSNEGNVQNSYKEEVWEAGGSFGDAWIICLICLFY